MPSDLVSVVIPAFNQAPFLAEAIQSVLNQSHQHIEVIVVNDASPDDTDAVVRPFAGQIRYLVHERNLGLSRTRNTGIEAAQGEFIAFLDADDIFHPDKLMAHVALYRSNSDAGATYNARFHLNHSAATIRDIWRPPPRVELLDLVQGFPFSPSDMVIRREWLHRVGVFDPAMGSAEDTDLPCRLALAGCQFFGVDRALNYRRFHSGRVRRNLAHRRNDITKALDTVFADPRCPESVRSSRGRALRNHLLPLVRVALIQEETDLAQELLADLVRCDASIVAGHPCPLTEYLMWGAIADAGRAHEPLLRSMFGQLPAPLSSVAGQVGWAVARGHLWKGLRAALWGGPECAVADPDWIKAPGARFDNRMLEELTTHLLNYEHEFGMEAAMGALNRLVAHVRRVSGSRTANRIRGAYLANRAFARYRSGDLPSAGRLACRAIASDPTFLVNRGLVAMLTRSLVYPAKRRLLTPS